MPAGKKQHISRHRAQAVHYAIGARGGLGWRFPSRSAVAEQFPAGALRPDLGSAASLIFTIVPFDQILVDFSHGSKTSQLTGAPGTLQRAGKHLGKSQYKQPILETTTIELATVWARHGSES